MEYAKDKDNNTMYVSESGELRFLTQDEEHLVYVKPKKYINYTPYRI